MSNTDTQEKPKNTITVEDIKVVADTYQEVEQELDRQFAEIDRLRSEISSRGREQVDHEELMFLASDLKHMAFKLHKNAIRVYEVAKADLAEIEAAMKLGKANHIIKSYGFTAMTDDLRKAAISSLPEMTRLRKHIGGLKAYADTTEGLVANLQSEEVNYRKSTDRRERLNGL